MSPAMFLKRPPPPKLRPVWQRGFALVELTIAISLGALLAVYASGQLARQSEETLAQGSGEYIKQVAAAAERHALLNFDEYSNNLPVTGVITPLRPTVAELVTLGRLNAGFPSAAGSLPTRQTAQIDIIAENCPGPSCTLTPLVCTTTPVTLGGANTRFDLVQTIVDVQGGAGGQSLQTAGGTIRGATLNKPNPLGNVEGIACGSSVVDTALFQRFVKIQDTRDPDLKGNLTVAGTTTINNNAFVTGALAVTGNTQAGSFSTTGTSTVGKLQLLDVMAAGGACATNGLLAQDASGQVLSCQSGAWKVQGDGKCVLNYTDLNFLQDDGRCYNGVGNANSPAGADWFFVEVYRHVNPANFFTAQRAYGMTGSSVGKSWLRNQQSAVSGGGWGPWYLTSSTGTSGGACAPDGSMAKSSVGVDLLCVGGTYHGMNTLIRSGTPGAACTVNGATAVDTANNNEQLICRLNPAGGTARYMRMRDVTQNLSFVSSTEVSDIANDVSNGGTGTGKLNKPLCTAAPGQTSVPVLQLTPKAVSTSDGGIGIYAIDGGTYWNIYLRNGAGGLLSGTPYATALAHVYCYFP